MSIKIGDRVRLIGAFLEVPDPQGYPLGTVIDILSVRRDEPFPPLRVEWDDSPATPGLHRAKDLEVIVSSDDPTRASAEGLPSQRCPVDAYSGVICDLPPGHTGLHQSGSEEERARRGQLNICRCGHDIRWHRIAGQVGTRMVEAGPCAHMSGSGAACSCSFFHPPSRRNLHSRDTEQVGESNLTTHMTAEELAHMRSEYRCVCERIERLRSAEKVTQVCEALDHKRELGLKIAAEERRTQ